MSYLFLVILGLEHLVMMVNSNSTWMAPQQCDSACWEGEGVICWEPGRPGVLAITQETLDKCHNSSQPLLGGDNITHLTVW